MYKKLNKITILIISLKKSKRIKFLIRRLKKLNLKYKIIDGINGKELDKENRLNKYFEKDVIKKKIGRKMSPSEIGAAASHIKAYKFIVKNKIQRAVIFEDDAFPSIHFKNWIKNTSFNEPNAILSFFAYPSGYLNKNKISKYDNNKISVFLSKTHIYSNSCYLINNQTAKKILKVTKGKVINYADWSFSKIKDKISLFVTVPFLVVMSDRGISNLSSDRNKILIKSNNIFKKLNSKKFLFLPKIFYYLFFIPFIFRKYQDLTFYLEHYFIKNYFRLKNIFFDSEIDLYKVSYNRNYYVKDLRREFDRAKKLF